MNTSTTALGAIFASSAFSLSMVLLFMDCSLSRRAAPPAWRGELRFPREAARGIAEWVAFYNDRRPHQALADRMPMAVWREVIVGARAVDMMDNASALPTCPQPQQQTQPLAA